MLAKNMEQDQKNWDLYLPAVLCAYRASEHSSTGYSPNKLVFQREIVLPVDIVMSGSHVTTESVPYDDYVQEQELRMQRAFTIARACMKKQAETRAARYNLRVKPNVFKPNDLVLYHYPRVRRNVKEKWSFSYIGPFTVLEKVGPVLYRIQKTPRSQSKLVYVDKLKRYHGVKEEDSKEIHPDADIEDDCLPQLFDTDVTSVNS